ncbi:neutral zinc metallopeptidase [Amycolatopsis marina]|uniref:neutral zinc metallopeptidase n=1 Tax=Amycolatopsis marina TaxID=490629 RepID=UPI001FECFA1E|nr:neutral zinc metallopeptidase [Amycolatopsis marina]
MDSADEARRRAAASYDPARVADLPVSQWRPGPHPVYTTPVVVAAPQAPIPPRNSPFAVVGVLGLVLGLVLAVAMVGRGVSPVVGVAVPASPGPADPVPGLPPGDPEPVPVIELGTNPLLAEGRALPAVACDLPGIGSGDAELRSFYAAALRCLDDAWEPVLAAAGEPFAEAGLEVTAEAPSECGDPPDEAEATAFYCGWDEVIYMPQERLLATVGLNRSAHLAVLAHEYGHHVQLLSGIMYALGEELTGVEEGAPAELELTRRTELQANCFAGLFLAAAAGRGSISEGQAQVAVEDFANSADSDTHGTLANQIAWARAGFAAEGTADCNTFDVPAHAVR